VTATATVFVWVRATVPWDDDDGYLEAVDEAFRAKIAVWNRTLTMPYNRFRHRLREIARRNHARIAGAVPARWEEIPEGAVVLPVDDDDWFAPEVATALVRARGRAVTAFRWPSVFLEVPTTFGHHVHLVRRALVPRTPPKQYCTTNNYALVKRRGVELVAANHMRAGEQLERDPGTKELPDRLSLMNRTLASQTTLGLRAPELTRGHLVRKYRRYRRLYEGRLRHVPAWARADVEAMAELMEDVRLRPRGAT
jgi:hypothetical protein